MPQPELFFHVINASMHDPELTEHVHLRKDSYLPNYFFDQDLTLKGNDLSVEKITQSKCLND